MDNLIQSILEGVKSGQWKDNENYVRKCLLEAKLFTEDELIRFATDCLKAKEVLLNPISSQSISITKEWLLNEGFECKNDNLFELKQGDKGMMYFLGYGIVSISFDLKQSMPYEYHSSDIQFQHQINKIRLIIKEGVLN